MNNLIEVYDVEPDVHDMTLHNINNNNNNNHLFYLFTLLLYHAIYG